MNGSRFSPLRWLTILGMVGIVATESDAQWSTDPASNLAIADRVSEQVLPKVAATADGGCYVGWFDLAAGSYDVYLQRLDPQGGELWPHNGVLISDHPQNSFLVDWDLIVDSQDHCVLVFGDNRNGGGDFDIYAYRVAPDGSMVWGPDGVTLSDDNGFEAAPRVAELSTGDFAFCWSRDTNGRIMAQVLDPLGVPYYPANGTPIGGQGPERAGFCEIAASDNGTFIVTWVRDTTNFASPRHVHAQKFDLGGAPQWGAGPVVVYDAASVPIAHAPRLRSDAAGGAVIVWHAALTTLFNCYVQRLDAGGVELFPHNGVGVSTDLTRNHLDPTFVYQSSTQETLVFFNERNSAQSQWGIYGQKLDASGARQWTNTGRELIPVNSMWKGPPRAVPSGAGAMVFVLYEPTSTPGQERVLGMRVDADGLPNWPGQPLLVSSLLSGKSRLPVAVTPQGAALVVWEDERVDAADIYGQRVGDDGTLGGGPPAGPPFVRGYCNPDSSFNIADAIALLAFLFPGVVPATLGCPDACDCNDDGSLNIADAVCLLGALFGQPAMLPGAPHPNCGPDPTEPDALDCAAFTQCP
ncbi:MAG: hypothetical protein AB7O52_11635 [Planctomycetota bacterium]